MSQRMHPTILWRYNEATFDQDSDQELGTKMVITDTIVPRDIMDTADTEEITTLWHPTNPQHHHLRE